MERRTATLSIIILVVYLNGALDMTNSRIAFFLSIIKDSESYPSAVCRIMEDMIKDCNMGRLVWII